MFYDWALPVLPTLLCLYCLCLFFKRLGKIILGTDQCKETLWENIYITSWEGESRWKVSECALSQNKKERIKKGTFSDTAMLQSRTWERFSHKLEQGTCCQSLSLQPRAQQVETTEGASHRWVWNSGGYKCTGFRAQTFAPPHGEQGNQGMLSPLLFL